MAKRISDQFKALKLNGSLEAHIMLIQAITRAILALLVVLIGGYLLISQIPVPESAVTLAYLILGAYFGVEAIAKFVARIGRH